MNEESKGNFPPQHQEKQPGLENEMYPEPLYEGSWYNGGEIVNE